MSAPVDESKLTFRERKELDNARRAGHVAPAVDEDGREINPHVPSFMSSLPFYAQRPGEEVGPTLRHQNRKETKVAVPLDFDRVQRKRQREERTGRTARRGTRRVPYVPGSCRNCGGSHELAACLEKIRPVSRQAATLGYTTVERVAEDVAPGAYEAVLDYEAKRDRWNGYDPREHRRSVEERQRREAERLVARGAGSEQQSTLPGSTDGRTYSLRNRNDTAKYLYNLDVNSAYYDPKSRSMRSNPLPPNDPRSQEFAGDNFVRESGDVREVLAATRFAWEQLDDKVAAAVPNPLANPSAAERAYRTATTEAEAERVARRKAVLEKYGGEEFLRPLPPSLATSPSDDDLLLGGALEDAVDDDDAVQATGMPQSKFPEDVFPGNHTSVWGSYWKDGRWGYSCCHEFEHASYCQGEVGRRLNDAEEARLAGVDDGAAVQGDAESTRDRDASGGESGSDSGDEDDGSSSSSEGERRRKREKKDRKRKKQKKQKKQKKDKGKKKRKREKEQKATTGVSRLGPVSKPGEPVRSW